MVLTWVSHCLLWVHGSLFVIAYNVRALTNRGAILHDVTIPALGFQLVAQPGQRAVGALTPTTPGTYEFYCSVPGHREAGMIGRLVVTP